MGRRRLTFGIVMGSAGLAVIMLSIIVGILIASNLDMETVIDEKDLTEIDEDEYKGQVYSGSLTMSSRARVRSRTDQQFDFSLVIRDPDGWVVKNHTSRTPFNRDLQFTTTITGYYEFRLIVLTPGVEKEDILFEVLGSEADPLQATGCTMMMCVGTGGGMLIFFGIILMISHIFGLFENEDRLKKQPDSTPVDVKMPGPKMVDQVPRGVLMSPPQGMSRYQYARSLEIEGNYRDAFYIYQELDLPVDAARCQSMYNSNR